ncbi:MAG: hypothetical protein FGM20_04395 [Burkholderiaceae bacterium]|jgi:hypothetical protein|nr:hypothetical protein [Burkholderiaceae bacterium]MBU6290828.1 MotA/TolQ/ExbB proton channel family protein [Burkholderiales bacterium]
MFLFAAWLLGLKGVWQLLLQSDPTGITFIIIVIFCIATAWCGTRSRELDRQRQSLEQQISDASASPIEGCWASAYWKALRAKPADAAAPLDLLSEQTHGPHSTAWWVNGLQLKLGLLGKVIGFSMLAMQIGHMQSFDQSQAQDMLRELTTGLGVALLTTMVGLVANILLGMQLTRLDRFADELIARAQSHGLQFKA